MSTRVSILIPYDDASATLALQAALSARKQGIQVVLAGPNGSSAPPTGVHLVVDDRGTGAAVQKALDLLAGDLTMILPPKIAIGDYSALIEPIASDIADVVIAAPASAGRLLERATSLIGRLFAGISTEVVRPGVTVLRTSVLRDIGLRSRDHRFEFELRVKLALRHFRIVSLPCEWAGTQEAPARSLARLRTLLHYGLLSNDADNEHEGYNTLARMDQAPRYNAWLGSKLRAHLGKRILEVGAGIGTITRELVAERELELVIALEADPFYVERLRNIFRNEPRVRPLYAPVETTDWDSLAQERLDSVVLSNVLEHIEDDGLAIRNFRRVLPAGGTFVALVPAIPALFGTIDEAIGHFRRYTPNTLRTVIESGGFQIQRLEWMNVLGIPGWFLNGRLLKRRSVPSFQLQVYDRIAPLLARAESAFELPVGLSLLAVARAL